MESLKIVQDLPVSTASDYNWSSWNQSCYDAMNDDFNTPILIAQLFEAVKQINSLKEEKSKISEEDKSLLVNTLHKFVFDVLGLQAQQDANNTQTETLEGVMSLLIDIRNNARANKDFATSDKIRDELTALGIQLKDGKDGTSFRIK